MSDLVLNASDLRERSEKELEKRMKELKEELFNLRFQHHTGQLENFMRISQVKKNIARVSTIQRERSVASVAASE